MGNNIVKPPSYLDTLNVVDIKSAQTLTRQYNKTATEMYEKEHERICTLLVKNINEKITFSASYGFNYIKIILCEKEYRMIIQSQYKKEEYDNIYFDKLTKFIKKKYAKFIITFCDYIDENNKYYPEHFLKIMW